MSDYGEYKVTVQTSEGEKARLIVHAPDGLVACQMAEQATSLHVVKVERAS